MSDAHAQYAPSSMYLTVACPGWQKQAVLMAPEPPTEATREGEAGHEVAASAAQHAAGAAGFVAAVGSFAFNGVEITEEMADGASLWVEALEGYPARIETRVAIKSVHVSKCWGTPDARQWNPDTRTHRTADYKYGHEFVDEFENWQLLAYTVGSLDEAYPTWRDDPGVTAMMTVVQPRFYNADPIRTWTIQTPGLLHYEARMANAVREAESPNPRVISGTHCTHCPARVSCPTFGKAVMHGVDFAGRPDPMASTPEQVGRELALVQEFMARLKARETGLAAMAESMIRTGQRVPFFALEQTEGRLAWVVPVDVLEMTARMFGKSVLKPPAAITPTQAKAQHILDSRVISEYSARPKGAFKLVRESLSAIKRKFTV